MKNIQYITVAGRLFVVGDIHGCFDLLDSELDKVDFDFVWDTLIAVGDLVDRGPDSEQAIEYIKQPWFYSVLGNHEAMLNPGHAGSPWHVMNGGAWFNDLVEGIQNRERALELVKPLRELPIMIEVVKGDKKFGFVHASLCTNTDWNKAKDICNGFDRFNEHPFIWDRYDVSDMKRGRNLHFFDVQNIDHVYFGHTPLDTAHTVGNCTWLDTGAFATGKLTLMEVS